MSLVLDNRCVRLFKNVLNTEYRHTYKYVDHSKSEHVENYNVLALYDLVKDSHNFQLGGDEFTLRSFEYIRDFENTYIVFSVVGDYNTYIVNKQPFVDILEQFVICGNFLNENKTCIDDIKPIYTLASKFETIDEYKQYTPEPTIKFYMRYSTELDKNKSNEVTDTILSKCPDFCFEFDEN